MNSIQPFLDKSMALYNDLDESMEAYVLPIVAGASAIAMCAQLVGIRAHKESSPVGNNVIRAAYQTFFDTVGLRRDTVIAEGFFQAGGTNFFSPGRASIGVKSDLFFQDRDAFGHLLKHETAHILNNDGLSGAAVTAVATLATTYLGVKFPEYKKTISIANLLITGICSILYTRHCEGKADDFAIHHSTDEELAGGRRAFKAMQWLNLQHLNDSTHSGLADYAGRLLILASGDDLSDFAHPSLGSRIEKIERAMRARGLPLETVTEYTKYKLTRLLL